MCPRRPSCSRARWKQHHYGEGADEAAIRGALEVACALDFVEARERAFRPIAQGGDNVSGGQRQRLSMARALVRRPRAYLFDDCFSALDYATDARVRAALPAWAAGSTVILVAQRISTVLAADRIVVLDEGRVAGVGTQRTYGELPRVPRNRPVAAFRGRTAEGGAR
ncbi:MAG: ATP-binding cassette domain-containing protein [Adlercreutzia sp.]